MELTQARPTVFVVDDNASIREAVKSLVESTGLLVDVRVVTTRTAKQRLASRRLAA